MTANQSGDGRILEAIAHNLCSLHDFDPEFVMGQERFARAVITEYIRAAPSPAAGSGEAVAWRARYAVGKTVDTWSLHETEPKWLTSDGSGDYEVQPLFTAPPAPSADGGGEPIGRTLYESFWRRNGGGEPEWCDQASAIRLMWDEIANDARQALRNGQADGGDDGWIEWAGGETDAAPVSGAIEWRNKHGDSERYHDATKVDGWRKGHRHQIIAYRVVPTPAEADGGGE